MNSHGYNRNKLKIKKQLPGTICVLKKLLNIFWFFKILLLSYLI